LNLRPQSAASAAVARVQALDWEALSRDLDESGNSIIRTLLDPGECAALEDMYRLDALFRNRVVMARHGFGRGEYRYFNYPLPDIIRSLRTSMYPHLAEIANRWNQALGNETQYPEKFDDFIDRCHRAGQLLPTPLLLRYGVGDFNCLHQDLYGEHVFPIQLAIQLSEPGRDFDGGEFVLTEQRPRMQSRVEVLTLKQGDAVVFPVQLRPVQGSRGYYRVNIRHGVSKIRAGERYTAGIIFHDAT